MSLSSTSTIKSQLNSSLGRKGPQYWDTLQSYLTGEISRVEFDELVRGCLDSCALIQLHNALIISLFDTSRQTPPTPPPDVPKQPPRKRRRALPYQGPDSVDTLRSSRLTRWTVGLGRRERERLRGLESVALTTERRPRRDKDEIARERGVVLLPERADPPGTRPSLHLASVAGGGPTFNHVWDKINLISSQNNLAVASKPVASLMTLAFKAKLKELINHALTLTSTSHAITSIKPAQPRTHSNVLTASTFETLFTVSPSALPNNSAAAMRLVLRGTDTSFDDDMIRTPEITDQRWQKYALLCERSTVRDALRTTKY